MQHAFHWQARAENDGLLVASAFLEQFPFAFVTDPSRAFVLGVATREDLSKFVSRRGLGSGAATPTQGAASSSQNGATSSQAPLFAASQPVANTNVADAPAAGRPQGFSTRREEEEARKDRSLAEFLLMLDGYQPLVS